MLCHAFLVLFCFLSPVLVLMSFFVFFLSTVMVNKDLFTARRYAKRDTCRRRVSGISSIVSTVDAHVRISSWYLASEN